MKIIEAFVKNEKFSFLVTHDSRYVVGATKKADNYGEVWTDANGKRITSEFEKDSVAGHFYRKNPTFLPVGSKITRRHRRNGKRVVDTISIPYTIPTKD